jgi:hypothetical protein
MQIIPAEKGWCVVYESSIRIADLIDKEDVIDKHDLLLRLRRMSAPVIAWGINPELGGHRFYTPTWGNRIDTDTLFFSPEGKCCYSLDFDTPITLANIRKWCEAREAMA